MDWTAIGAAIVAGIVTIGGISVFLAKYMPRFIRVTALAKDAVETISDIAQALNPDADGKVELTADEITKIKSDAVQFQKDWAIIKAS